MLQRLDPKIGLSETLLGELLDFDVVAEALIKQPALRESTDGLKGKGKGLKGGKSRAYLAKEDWNGVHRTVKAWLACHHPVGTLAL